MTPTTFPKVVEKVLKFEIMAIRCCSIVCWFYLFYFSRSHKGRFGVARGAMNPIRRWMVYGGGAITLPKLFET